MFKSYECKTSSNCSKRTIPVEMKILTLTHDLYFAAASSYSKNISSFSLEGILRWVNIYDIFIWNTDRWGGGGGGVTQLCAGSTHGLAQCHFSSTWATFNNAAQFLKKIFQQKLHVFWKLVRELLCFGLFFFSSFASFFTRLSPNFVSTNVADWVNVIGFFHWQQSYGSFSWNTIK